MNSSSERDTQCVLHPSHLTLLTALFSRSGLLRNYPGPVAALSAQFPDPHFKKRHKKRRMVQPSVVEVARERLMPGGEVTASNSPERCSLPSRFRACCKPCA